MATPTNVSYAATTDTPILIGLESAPPPPPPSGSLVLSAPSSGTVGVAGAATIQNTTAGDLAWTLAGTGGLTPTPASGTTVAGQTTNIALAFGSAGAATLSLSSSGAVSGTPASITVAAAPALVVSGGALSGTIGVASAAWTVTGINLPAGTTNVSISRAPSGTLSTPGLALTPSSPSGQFTLTPVATGAHLIGFTNDRGIANPGSVSYAATDVAAPTTATLSVSNNSALAGGSVTATVTLNVAADQTYVITLSEDGANSSLSGSTITITAGNSAGSRTLTNDGTGEVVQVSIASVVPTLSVAGSPRTVTFAVVEANMSQYRSAQPYLFASLTAGTIPNRLPGGFDFQIDGSGNFAHGPTRDYVDWGGWAWDNAGGDWIDATLSRMGNTPWASVATPAAADNAIYSVLVTEALRYCVQVDRWNAWIVRVLVGAAARDVYGRFAGTAAYRPRIEVTYTDTTTETLACRVSAYMSTGSSTPLLAGAYHTMGPAGTGGLALEFDRPSKPVQTATLYFTVYRHWGGAATFEFNLADPPINSDPVEYGVAQAYLRDAGLSGHASIIGQHRYHDGSVVGDYVSSLVFDTEATYSWSPELTGGAQDLTKLPHADLGKWIGGAGFYGNAVTVVPSSYTGNGFSPLAPGVGALRVVMPRKPGVQDGYYDPGYGEGAANTFIMMPESRNGQECFGTLRHIFVRYYLRIGTTSETGDPYNVTMAQHYQYNRSGGSPAWAAMGGKCGIGAAHKTRSGGNSGQAGGGHGWSLRWENGILHYDAQSPSFGGWGRSLSWTDYQDNAVVGHRYGSANQFSKRDAGLGQRGGLGTVHYANRWYCIEEEIYLNSVDQPSGAGDGKYWTPDGYYKAWLDGRLVYSKTGIVFRSLPLENWFPSLMGTVREVGIAHLWFNWFNGGTTDNAVDQVVFITGLAYGEQYIGPMSGVYPSWRAA